MNIGNVFLFRPNISFKSSLKYHFCQSTLLKVNTLHWVWAELTLNPRTFDWQKNVCLDDKDSVSRLVDEVIKLS